MSNKYGWVNPPEQPDPCYECGKVFFGKGKSGYYDVCDECAETDHE